MGNFGDTKGDIHGKWHQMIILTNIFTIMFRQEKRKINIKFMPLYVLLVLYVCDLYFLVGNFN